MTWSGKKRSVQEGSKVARYNDTEGGGIHAMDLRTCVRWSCAVRRDASEM